MPNDLSLADPQLEELVEKVFRVYYEFGFQPASKFRYAETPALKSNCNGCLRYYLPLEQTL